MHEKALAMLDGKASIAAIRRKATGRGLETGRRANADRAADYLLSKGPYLDYLPRWRRVGLSPPAWRGPS
ncbi:MAG TPA: hypothetical protein VM287_03175 [Egibacteraceae bacterium]|nr:hypothetical protein [Egibacteraceae bacterium]